MLEVYLVTQPKGLIGGLSCSVNNIVRQDNNAMIDNTVTYTIVFNSTIRFIIVIDAIHQFFIGNSLTIEMLYIFYGRNTRGQQVNNEYGYYRII